MSLTSKPLADNIIEIIEAMFLRPKMYASSTASFEEQLFTLITLVAPYTDWGFGSIEAGERLRDLAFSITRSNVSMSCVITDIDEMAGIFAGWYRNGFRNPAVKEKNLRVRSSTGRAGGS